MSLEEKLYSITKKNTAKASIYRDMLDQTRDYETYAWLADLSNKTSYSGKDVKMMFDILKNGSVAA